MKTKKLLALLIAAVMVLGAMGTMLGVRHGDSQPERKRGLEALDVED